MKYKKHDIYSIKHCLKIINMNQPAPINLNVDKERLKCLKDSF
jgi:hypothetical protein